MCIILESTGKGKKMKNQWWIETWDLNIKQVVGFPLQRLASGSRRGGRVLLMGFLEDLKVNAELIAKFLN